MAELGLGADDVMGGIIPPKKDVYISCSEPVNVTYWGRGLCKCNWVKGIEIPNDKCPCKSEAEGYLAQKRRHRERGGGSMMWKLEFCSHESRNASSYQMQEEAKNGFSTRTCWGSTALLTP